MAYASYEFYTADYLGNVIKTRDDFDRLAVRASTFLDYFTRGKSKANQNMEELKMACCAIAEKAFAIESAEAKSSSANGELQSESVGSYSVSYRSGAEVAASLRTEMASVAREYLAHTGLLYRGGCQNVCSAHCDCL